MGRGTTERRETVGRGAGRAIGRTLALGLLASLMMGGTALAAGWGAIAYHPATGRYGVATDQGSEGAARQAAAGKCTQRGCAVVATFPKCAAVSWDPRSKRWGWSRGNSQAEARKWALQRCRDQGGRTCRVLVAACNR